MKLSIVDVFAEAVYQGNQLAVVEEAAGLTPEQMQAIAREMNFSETTFVTPWQIGTLYTRAGDAELALDYLEQAFEERDPNIPYLSVDPIFDYLRGEPRFQALIRRLGLPQ